MAELEKTFSPKEAQSKWYQIWENGNYFRPKKGGKPFCIVMPPPNVTGQLHMGHALDITTQDALIRFKRMKGFETLFLPGMDHAGIATQAVVEKKIYKEEKKSRHDFTREEFLKKIWEWKEEYGGIILNQQRSMGASADWNYFMFTMDHDANVAVNKTFVNLYNEGLIYQSNRLVNWDPVLQSAVSDAEVEHVEVKGSFYHIKYKIKNSDQYLEVATTRPETMFGDTAVAVNPEDERWKHLIGKKAIVPICNREVPIIGDSYVDLEKGTGCLKVTPGHDFNDFEIGKRHELPLINILNLDGTLNQEAGEYSGLSCQKARKLVVEKLKELEQLVDIKEHLHSVAHGERSHEIIEPLLSKQWFLNVAKMSEVAVTAVEQDQTRFYPKGWENTYFSWLRDPKDWCLSRQLWWGHQIPVFYCNKCEHQWASEEKPKNCPKCETHHFHQDPDVLDTWFSSGIWPLTTLGWPDHSRMKARGFDRFFPTSVLVTGYDIIFFWVARMMMMGIKETQKVPFEKVYIHAIVRDKLGRKMSKSLGNGIDPLEIIDTYGADALRFTLAAGSGYNRNLNLDPKRIEGFRNFINKIWNAFRFIEPNLESGTTLPPKISHHEKWILSELNDVTKIVNDSLEDFRFDDATSAIYSFTYEKFCSYFIELSKPILYGENLAEKSQRAKVLKYCFRKLMALLHPFTPFITEELWSYLKEEGEDLMISYPYPEYDPAYDFKEESNRMNKFIETVAAIRALRSEVNLPPKEEVDVHLFLDDEELKDYFKKSHPSFVELARLKNLYLGSKMDERPKKSAINATTFAEVFLPLEGHIDINEQIKRLQKDLDKTQADYMKVRAKLENNKFMESAPPEIIEEVKSKAESFESKIESLRRNIGFFNS
jgi:valyl-tRNA synthetase